MTYRQTPVKGEGQIVSEYREMSDKEKLHEAQQYMKSLRKQVSDLEDDSMRYRRLRQLEVVIMAEDGAKYLKGSELDEYLDNLPAKRFTRAELLKELTPALNNIFGAEYAKYEAEHGDLISSHLDAMEAIHDKT
jgi:hypothetical protein